VNKVIRIGMDTSKHLFQLHGVDAAEEAVLRRKLRRSELERFFKSLPPTVVVIEACAGAHHLARQLRSWGHTPKLLAPQHAKPYRGRNKNDAADANGLCEAGGRPHMRFVPEKSPEQQAALMLAGVRDQLIRARTQIANAIRGYAAEFGLIAPKGLAHIGRLLDRVETSAEIPPLAKKLFALQAERLAALAAPIAEAEAELQRFARENELCRRLMAREGVGPVGAALLVIKTPDPGAFRSSRAYAAWVGLTCKDHSTAGKQRLGGITRAGDEALRATLVAGAMAVIRHAEAGKASPWLKKLLARKSKKLAAVALANKTARVAWKLMTTGERYDPSRARAAAPAVG
jgi:transposase